MCRAARMARFAFPCNISFGRTRISAAMPAGSPAGVLEGRHGQNPSVRAGRRDRIHLLGDERVGHAEAGQSVTVTIDGDLDISRGDMIVAAVSLRRSPTSSRDHHLDEQAEMLPGKRYILKTEGRSATATMARPLPGQCEQLREAAGNALSLNDIATCNISLDRPIAFDPYQANRTTGSFVLIDPDTNATAGAGMIEFGAAKQNIHWQAMDVDKSQRAGAKGRRRACSGSAGCPDRGKSRS